jgi:hypothetical protein
MLQHLLAKVSGLLSKASDDPEEKRKRRARRLAAVLRELRDIGYTLWKMEDGCWLVVTNKENVRLAIDAARKFRANRNGKL